MAYTMLSRLKQKEQQLTCQAVGKSREKRSIYDQDYLCIFTFYKHTGILKNKQKTFAVLYDRKFLVLSCSRNIHNNSGKRKVCG
jgi:hypothetical protein